MGNSHGRRRPASYDRKEPIIPFWNKPPKEKPPPKINPAWFKRKYPEGKSPHKGEVKFSASQWQAYKLVMLIQGIKVWDKRIQHFRRGVIKYAEGPPIRYELKGDKIIRTVDTFHYISQYTRIDGICRSFKSIQKKFIPLIPLHGKEAVPGVHDIVWRAFNARYFLGRITFHDSEGSDLNIPIKWVAVNISGNSSIRHKYYIVKLKKDDDWTEWRMFEAGRVLRKRTCATKLNPVIPLTMSQVEIIENLKNGSITTVNEYGNPEKIYTSKEVLEILKV